MGPHIRHCWSRSFEAMGSPEGTSYLRNVFNTLCNKIWFDSFVSCEVGGHSLRHNYIFHFKKESRTSGTGAKILRGSASCRQTAHRARRLLGITRLRDGFPKKKELFFWILFKLPQPPRPHPPNFGQLVPLFWNANVPKNVGQGPPPSSPSPNWPNIQFVKSGQKIWARPSLPPLIWTKSNRTATFFSWNPP